MGVVKRKTCRICNSKSLKKVIDLGNQHLQGLFVKPGTPTPPVEKFPTSLVLCDSSNNSCGLLQLEYTVPPEILYSTYWYRSGTNQTMRNHLKGITEEATNLIKKDTACVLDIGCNDGTLLNYYPDNFKKIGIDPSNATSNITSNITVIKDFFPSRKLRDKLNNNSPDIITSIAMFYDLENPTEFVKEIKDVLSKDGVWILELAYMPIMLENNSYDTICHEHLEYYSLSVIDYVLNKSDLKVFNATLNSINGGSIRCYITHKSNNSFSSNDFDKNIKRLKEKEVELKLNTEEPYLQFQKRINNHKQELHSLLVKLKSQGKKIHIYGASTKGNTILQWCETDNSIIEYAAERNPDKFGAYTLGTNIPIISEEESRKMNPDFYLVLPWHFKEEFLKREQEIINKGTALIFPLPEIEIIKK